MVLHYPLANGTGPVDMGAWLRGVAEARATGARDSLSITIENRAENNDGVSHQRLDDPAILVSVLAEWDLGLTLDVAHAHSMNLSVPALIDALRGRIRNVHLSDANGRHLRGGVLNGLFRDHQQLGSGAVPLRDTIEALVRIKYQELVTLEFNPWSARAWCPPIATGTLRANVQTARNDVGVARYLHVVSESERHRHAR